MLSRHTHRDPGRPATCRTRSERCDSVRMGSAPASGAADDALVVGIALRGCGSKQYAHHTKVRREGAPNSNVAQIGNLLCRRLRIGRLSKTLPSAWSCGGPQNTVL